jgi:hypothetical protein
VLTRSRSTASEANQKTALARGLHLGIRTQTRPPKAAGFAP